MTVKKTQESEVAVPLESGRFAEILLWPYSKPFSLRLGSGNEALIDGVISIARHRTDNGCRLLIRTPVGVEVLSEEEMVRGRREEEPKVHENGFVTVRKHVSRTYPHIRIGNGLVIKLSYKFEGTAHFVAKSTQKIRIE